MGENNTVVSAYIMYRHLQQYCSHPSIGIRMCFRCQPNVNEFQFVKDVVVIVHSEGPYTHGYFLLSLSALDNNRKLIILVFLTPSTSILFSFYHITSIVFNVK